MTAIEFPSHLSPSLPPTKHSGSADNGAGQLPDPPASLLSPAFTPPAAPDASIQASQRHTASEPVDERTASSPPPKLLPTLPEVTCEVRARIPTTTGQQMFLYLYHNNIDNKEHLAIVFGDHIRSRSLDAPRPGETERDRLIRGAYDGRLHPGRMTSRINQPREGGGQNGGHRHPPAPLPAALLNGHASSHTVLPTDVNAECDQFHESPPLVRIHSECYTGETVWSARCDCGEQLDEAQRLMCLPGNKSGGVIIYLRQEGRGIGLSEKLKAYNLQDLGHDTYEANLLLRHPADARSYGIATAMLVDLGLGGNRGIKLLTNNPDKIRAVEGPNREVVVKERVAMIPLAWQSGGSRGVQGKEVEKYLSTKIEKFKHLLER